MRIYVGTYAKYNNGNLFGKWLTLADYNGKGEFIEACKELHDDEEDPEFMFQDWEDIPSSMVGECHVDEGCWELLEAYDNYGNDAVNAYCSIFGKWDERDFQDRYRGKYTSWTDLAEQLLEDTGDLEAIPESLRYYFDYEKYGRDLHYDFCEEDGHYFWNC